MGEGTSEPVSRLGWASRGSLPHLAALGFRVWQQQGARGVAAALRARLYADLRFVRFRVDLARWTIEPRAIPAGVTVGEGHLEDLWRYRSAVPDAPRQFFMNETQEVRRFYVAMVDEEIGHISWVFTHTDRLLHMVIGPNEIALDGAYTPNRFRGRGLLSLVERAILDDAKRDGFACAYTHVQVDNVASIRGVLRTGFQPVGIVRRRWVLGMPVIGYDDDARALGDIMAGRLRDPVRHSVPENRGSRPAYVDVPPEGMKRTSASRSAA